MTFTGRSQQKKGRAGERELTHVLQGYGYDVKPAEPMNYGTVPDLFGLPQIHVECKRQETTKIWDWFSQSQVDAEKFRDGMPAVFFRRSRSPWMVCMALSDWVELYNYYSETLTKNLFM